MAKQATYKYSGILNKPMGTAAAKDDYQYRIEALAEDCGVDFRKPMDWQTIALTLAARHVPGFRVGAYRGRGRPKWQMGEDLALIMAMEERIANNHSIRRAAALVARERRRGESWRALESQYRRFQKRTREVFGAKLFRVRPHQYAWRKANTE